MCIAYQPTIGCCWYEYIKIRLPVLVVLAGGASNQCPQHSFATRTRPFYAIRDVELPGCHRSTLCKMATSKAKGEGEMMVAKSEGDGKEKLYVEKVF